MKKIIKRIVDRIRFSYPIMIEESLTKILEEELPDFQRIDEERINAIHERLHDEKIHRLSTMFSTIKEYNSTLPPALKPLPKDMPKEYNSLATPYQVWLQVQQEYGTPANNLQPLPKDMPKYFFRQHSANDADDLWEWLLEHYGTPAPKSNLPSVEELARELNRVYWGSDKGMTSLAQHLHDKYSLHPREWWQDLKEGDKFMWKGQVKTFRSYEIEHKLYIEPFPSMVYCPASDCTPYTPPTASEIIAKHNLSEEEIRAIREGKCT